jgi:hypothetical protein
MHDERANDVSDDEDDQKQDVPEKSAHQSTFK